MKRNPQAGVRRQAGLRLEVFSDADLDDIHRGTLEVLERTGVFVESDEALDVMADGGCQVDRENKTVKIPPHVVEDAVRAAPASVRLAGRVPENDIVLDCFAGSGNTGLAAKNIGRKSILIEIDHKWVNSIRTKYVQPSVAPLSLLKINC